MNHYDATTDPLSAFLDSKNREPLKRASDVEAAVSLCQLMNEQVPEYPYVDGDRLASAAWAFEQVQKWNAPAVAIGWLKEGPSHARLAVAWGVLLVAWNRQPEMPAIDPQGVEDVLAIYGALPHDDQAQYGLLMVLTRLTDPRMPTTLRARVTHVVEQASQLPDLPPDIRRVVTQYFNHLPR